MAKGHLQIHSENILPIIKKWLYSDKDIFVRELVSNSCDAIQKVKILMDQGAIPPSEEEFRIEVKIDKQAKTLTFIDNGVGMDAEEVEKYIAQIAFSGAEEFLNQYKTNNEKDQFIGHFGLGFYSAYMVAEKVEINTLSYKQGAEPVKWTCDGSSDYEMEKGALQKRGTEITLYIDKDNQEYLEDSRLKQILDHYCAFLPYPVYLGDKHLNHQIPLWTKAPNECTENDYLAFYRYLYPMQPDPLFWVHLNADYPFHLKGILYFPKLGNQFDINKNTIKLFCNRVFVSDNCKDLIPDYLMVLRGVIDSPDIPLNVSRSYLQMDRTVRQLANHISKKVSDSLSHLYKSDRNRFLECWEDISTIVKIGAIEDEKFYERVKEFLIWKNIEGQWTTVEEYLEHNKEKTQDKIFYTKDEKHAAHILAIYRQKGIEVLCASHPIDNYLINYLERKISPTTFKRIDASVDEHLLDTTKEKTLLDADGRTEAARLADFVRLKLGDETTLVEAKSLAMESLPGFIMIDESQRRLRDYMQTIDPKNVSHSVNQKTFVVNTNNPLMMAIQKIDGINPELAKEMVHEVYELTLLSQKEIDASMLHDFIGRSNRVLEQLAMHIVKKNE